jgi:hypothetical protein
MMRVHTEVNSGKLAPCKLGYQQAVGIRNRKLPRGLLQLQLPRVPHCIACGSGMLGWGREPVMRVTVLVTGRIDPKT